MNVFTRYLSGASAALVTAALLAGCGGGGASSAAPPVSSGGGTSPMSITVSLPGRSTTTKTGKRIPLYTSIDTKGIGVEYQAHAAGYSGSPSSSPTFGAQIGAGVSNSNVTCTPAASNGSYSCTLYIPSVPVGYDDFRVALWNAAPNGCTSSGSTCNFLNTGDKVLSFSALANQAIVGGINNHAGLDGATPPPNSVNNLSFTLNPVVDSVTVTLGGTGQLVDGIASNTTAYVSAKDAAGNVILTSGSDSFVDASGNPLTISLSIVNNCGSSLSFTAPGASPAYSSATSGNTASVHYDGLTNCPTAGSLPAVHASVNHAISGTSFDGTFIVTSSSASATIPGVPQVTAQANVGGFAGTIASASDGNLYTIANNLLVEFNPSAPASTNPVTVATTTIIGVAAGSDGDVWYTDWQHQAVVHQNVGTAGNNVVSKAIGASAQIGYITAGPDGNMWFAISNDGSGNSKLASINPAGSSAAETITTYGSGSGGSLIAAGTMNNGDRLACGSGWDTGASGTPANTVETICRNISQATTSTVAVGTGASNGISAMGFGADGLLYVGENDFTIHSFYMDATHTLTAYHTYSLSPGFANDFAIGPDGNLWFTVNGDASHVIGVITPTKLSGGVPSVAGTLNDWGGYAALGLSGSPSFNRLITGADHNLWVTDSSANHQVDRISL